MRLKFLTKTPDWGKLIVVSIVKYIAIFSLILTQPAWSKPIVIAVIDTGYVKPERPYVGPKPVFCKLGHVDFTKSDRSSYEIPDDTEIHGHNIVHVIANEIGEVPEGTYCIVLIKYWSKSIAGSATIENSLKAFKWADALNVDVINYSSNGDDEDPREDREIKKILNKGIKVVVAAGNDGNKIQKWKPAYPAMVDSRLVVVGNMTQEYFQHKGSSKESYRHPTSNYGSVVNRWEVGTRVCGGNWCMTGTSQATAVATGKIVKEMIENRKGSNQ